MNILTSKLIKDAIDYLRSDEYTKKSIENQRIRCNAETIVIKAYQQNKISEFDYCRYVANIQINGMLVLHPKDKNYKILSIVAKEISNEIQNNRKATK